MWESEPTKRRVKNSTVPLSSLCCVWLRLGCPLGNLPDSMHSAELVETDPDCTVLPRLKEATVIN